MNDTKKPAKRTAGKASEGFTDEEKAAMRERAKEARRGSRGSKADGEADLLAKIAEMADTDRAIAERVHAIVTDRAPASPRRRGTGCRRTPRTARSCASSSRRRSVKTRSATIGFNDSATLDDGDMWPT